MSLLHKDEFSLDISAFKEYKLQDYMLNRFNIIENIIDPANIKFHSKWPLIKDLLKMKPNEFYHYKEKYKFQYDERVLSQEGNVYLDGSWQSERYFVKIRDTILKDLTVKTPPSSRNLELLQEIQKKNSVAIHIRRQDYVNNPKTLEFHGSCSIEYYKKCIAMMCERVPDPTFFIFSDDPAWAEQNIKTGHSSVYINNNGKENGQEDLRLLSNCSHFIIANSSFSWWGAWLSTNRDKIVLVPKPWIRSKELTVKDMIPSSWVEVPSD